MSERTGATDAVDYIAELIARRIMHPSSVYMNGAFRDDAEKYKCVRYAREILSDITSDGMVIARAADVVRPYHVIVDVDDLKLVLGNQTVYSAEDDDLHQAICRLEAIAEGGTE